MPIIVIMGIEMSFLSFVFHPIALFLLTFLSLPPLCHKREILYSRYNLAMIQPRQIEVR
jgi:hypothetical protein